MDQIDELLTRGVDTIYPSKEALEKVLRSGKKLTLYQGFDPTGTRLHIGHMVGFKKLRAWQKLGHHVIFLIGDGTGQAGDPSGKTKARDKFFNNEELRKNAVDYVKQAAKIVDFEGENPIQIVYNGDWLNKLSLAEILDLAGHFTVQQLIERDLFQERIKKNEPINLREFLYPLLQGYDSVAMKVDLELGGKDQTFNMLAGRQLVKDYLNKEKFVMTTPLLTDSEGRKIGKTEGNVIGLIDEPEDLYAKILALPDDIIVKGFEFLTDIAMNEIQNIKQELDNGANPITYKKQLAFEIVKELNDENAAQKAQEEFENIVVKKEVPIIDIPFNENPTASDALLTELDLAESKSEAKRLIEQGGVEVDSKKLTNPNEIIDIKEGMIIKVGKRKLIRIKKK
ncbi:MAG: tyrosine--tRNA ligase [Candidatus Levyibacteriota bacterium]